MFRQLTCLLLAVSIGKAIRAQTPEINPRLRTTQQEYPESNANNDGSLTASEAQSILRNNSELRADQGDQTNRSKALKDGVRYIYKNVADLELSLYVFTPIEHHNSDAVPAAVFFFGGGWTSGSADQFQLQCQHLAKRGMIGITVDYRVASRHSAKIEDCVEDAKSAIRWVRSNASKLGVDPDRIAACGGSAGGHLAVCTAVIEEFNATTDDLQVSAKPNAMVLFNPALAIFPHDRMSPQELRMAEGVSDRARTSMANLSPLKFVSYKQPPLIMFYGTKDPLLNSAKFYKQESERVGNTCKLVTYEGQDHGFFNRGKHLEMTIAEMDNFLTGLDWIAQDAPR